jgi:hypothetical protein
MPRRPHGDVTREDGLTARTIQEYADENWPTLRADGASGFVCPHRGGALWGHDERDSASLECRIGDRFTEAEMWIAPSVARNRALLSTARVLAEHAALARRLVESAERGDDTTVGAPLHEEARVYAQVRAMTEGLSGTPWTRRAEMRARE